MAGVGACDLTPKQMHFARCVASGMNYSEAYREAYGKGKATAKTINEMASKLMTNPKIVTRVEALIRARERAITASSVSDRERVLRKLREFADDALPTDAVRLRATELLGKTVGLFRDVIETPDRRTPAEVEEELRALLAQLSDRSSADSTSADNVPEDDAPDVQVDDAADMSEADVHEDESGSVH